MSALFNVSTLMHQNKIRLCDRILARTTERMATGSRINSAKDDPFRNSESLSVSSEIRRSERAKQNSSDGSALLQMADGACSEVHNILQRVRELAVQSANDTLSSSERHFLNVEAQELLKEVERISVGTTFNKKQIFGNQGDSFSGENRDLRKLRDEPELKYWNPFIRKDEDGNDIRAGILHIGPNTNVGKYHDVNEVRVSIPEISIKTLGLSTLSYAFSLTYQGAATRAIDDLDSAISSLGIVRSYMGSIINKMDEHIETLEEKSITNNDYIGKIKDADIAKESTALISAQIQQQAAVSMLAQCNSKVNRVLEVLWQG